MRKFKVEIKKTVQVKQFEPVTITLTTEEECEGDTLHSFLEKRDTAYDELKDKMNEIFGQQQESCLD